MAVVLRMKRTGRKNRPSYRISATDSRNPRDGRTLETLGHYDPASPKESLRLSLDVERAKYWLDQGAKPSDTVASLLRLQGVVVHRPKKKRERPGRSKKTRTRERRAERAQALQQRKAARRAERLAARRAAAKAAPAEGTP
jgi:small subunit ribosomal protein S16